MKPVKDLTDQELNEWVAVNIFKWPYKKVKMVSINERWYKIPTWILNTSTPKNPHSGCYAGFAPPDYCQDLNHSYLMEEKIKELGYSVEYAEELAILILENGNKDDFIGLNKIEYYFIAHASARQRCEAAYLTFNKNNE